MSDVLSKADITEIITDLTNDNHRLQGEVARLKNGLTYVWILETGEDYEGGYIKDIYSTEEKAMAGVKQLQALDDDLGPWEPREPSGELSRVWHRPGEWMTLTKREVL